MYNKFAGIEKRKFKRVAVYFIVFCRVSSPLRVRIKIGNREVEALAVDISEGGMAVYTDCEIPPVAVVSVKFIMINDYAVSAQDGTRSILVRGEVRYNIFIEEKKTFRFGMQFMDLPVDDRIFVSNFVAKSK
jgi:c-di-GMP-binding flagellar brake protein YcgR